MTPILQQLPQRPLKQHRGLLERWSGVGAVAEAFSIVLSVKEASVGMQQDRTTLQYLLRCSLDFHCMAVRCRTAVLRVLRVLVTPQLSSSAVQRHPPAAFAEHRAAPPGSWSRETHAVSLCRSVLCRRLHFSAPGSVNASGGQVVPSTLLCRTFCPLGLSFLDRRQHGDIFCSVGNAISTALLHPS